MKRMIRKLRGAAGETIAETLVGLLIAAFAMMTLAGMIGSTVKVVKKSETKMTAYYEANEKLENFSGETHDLSFEVKEKGDDGTVRTVGTIPVEYIVNDVFSKEIVVAYHLKQAGATP